MKTADFAFIVHSRDRSDLPRKFPWLKLFPRSIFDLITTHLPPIVVSKISGLLDSSGNALSGIVLGIPMTAHQLLEHREKALKRIIEAVRIARSRGAKYVGLGAMTASLSKGGRDVISQIDNVYVTTGRTFTVMNITEYVLLCVKIFGLNPNNVRIGIVGAAGGIGSGVAISLARKQFKKFKLIDLERKLINLQERIKTLESHSEDLDIEISHHVSEISSCDIVIAATSSPEIVIKSEDVNPGTIIINDAQPSDISPEILRERTDVLVIEGGVLHAPNIDCHFNFGLSHKNDVFSCLAETLLLTNLNIEKHHSIDDFDADLYTRLEDKAKDFGYSRCMQNDMGIISDIRIEEFAKMRKSMAPTD